MTGIFSKVRIITLSNFHTLLNKTIDLNSVGAIEQNVRDLSEARKDLEGELAEAKYLMTKTQTNLAQHGARDAQLAKSITTLGSENPASRQLAVELVALRKTVDTEKSTLDTQQTNVANLTNAVSAVRQKEADMNASLGKLRALEATTKAQNRATSAIENAASAMGDGSSIDNVTDRLERHAARSTDAFNRSVNSMPGTVSTESPDVDALLAELTKKPETAA